MTYRLGVLTYATVATAAQSPIQTVVDSAARYPNGTVFGNAASYGYAGTGQGVFAPGPSYHHQFGNNNSPVGVTPGQNIRGSLQGMFGNVEFFGPTQDDSAQSANHGVYMKDPVAAGGIAYTQANPVVGDEFDVQIENHVTINNTYMLGAGSRSTILQGATITNSPNYGFKASGWAQNNKGPTTYGAMFQWRAFYDDLYNPAGSSFAVNQSFYGLNQITSEQGFNLSRTGYGGSASLTLQGSGGSENSLMLIQVPSPNTTTSVADGAFTSGSNLVTTATAPTAGWIGRVIGNANVPAGTQVLNYYGSGPYTIVMTANATATASAQTVTFTEPTLTGLRINMAAGMASGNAISVYDTGGAQRFVVSRTGIPRTIGVQFNVQNGSGQTLLALNQDGSVQPGTNVNSVAATGARVWSGSGAPGTASPNYPGGTVTPAAGDWYWRTDTPTTANQRLYICTVGGATPTWVGVV